MFKQLESDIDPIWELYEQNKKNLQAIFEAERHIGRAEMLCDIIDRERTAQERNHDKQSEKWVGIECPI